MYQISPSGKEEATKEVMRMDGSDWQGGEGQVNTLDDLEPLSPAWRSTTTDFDCEVDRVGF